MNMFVINRLNHATYVLIFMLKVRNLFGTTLELERGVITNMKSKLTSVIIIPIQTGINALIPVLS